MLTLTHLVHRRIAPRTVVSSVVEPPTCILVLSGSWIAGVPISYIRPTNLCQRELTALTSRLSRQHADSHALRLRWRVSFGGEPVWDLPIQSSVRMVEWDDKCVARSCIRTHPLDHVAMLAVARHSREPSVTMVPLIAATP